MQQRIGTSDDGEAVLALLSAAGCENAGSLRDELGASDALLVVAVDTEVDGVAGVALGRQPEPDLLQVSAVLVHPDARHRGIGGALLDGLADAAFARGARRLVAEAHTAAQRAFLLACGLRATDATRYIAELEPPARELVVRGEGLRLGQLLKLAGLAETGAEAKALLAAGEVEVNGEVDSRRGRQLADGDVVATGERAVRLVFGQGGETGPRPADAR